MLTAPQAGAAPSTGSPQYVQCVAPETGAVGPTGATGVPGATGPKGDTGFTFENGPARATHVRGVIPCALIPVLCLDGVYQGGPGAQGPIGATGPKGDTGPVFVSDGPARRTHLRGGGGLGSCEQFPRSCTYGVQGRPGATGAVGDTGPKGATGEQEPAPINGPSRTVHRGLGGTAGSVIELPDCDLPLTGGSTPLLPYALLLLAAGGVVLMVVQRRRSQAV